MTPSPQELFIENNSGQQQACASCITYHGWFRYYNPLSLLAYNKVCWPTPYLSAHSKLRLAWLDQQQVVPLSDQCSGNHSKSQTRGHYRRNGPPTTQRDNIRQYIQNIQCQNSLPYHLVMANDQADRGSQNRTVQGLKNQCLDQSPSAVFCYYQYPYLSLPGFHRWCTYMMIK